MIKLKYRSAEEFLVGGQYWRPPCDVTENTYRDTPASTQQAIVAAIRNGTPWREVVADYYQADSQWLHRIVTDPCRDLFFRQNPLPSGATVLDVGAGWGQMSLPLARQHTVVALEPTRERLEFIHAVAHQENLSSRLICVESDFFDVAFEPIFDVACCIGVLEWVPRFREGDPLELQRCFLTRMRSVLKPEGKLVVGIENRLGLKYLLGSSDDHIGAPNIALLDGSLARQRFKKITGKELRSFTYTLAEYRTLFSSAGFSELRVYAAYPDYKVPKIIAPLDEHLEVAITNGLVLPDEHDGSSGGCLPTEFQEVLRSHYRSLAENGISRFFAPSFFLEASNSLREQQASGSRL